VSDFLFAALMLAVLVWLHADRRRRTVTDDGDVMGGCPLRKTGFVDIRESILVVDMWMVEDGAGNDVAYIEDEDKAIEFQGAHYPDGRVEFITCLETL
jgi:hypothetical protein